MPSDIVLQLSSLSYPSTSAELCGREAPLYMEIGVGSGGFVDELCGHRPDVNVLGVDLAPQSVARSYRRLRASGRPHGKLIKADALFVVRNVIAPGELHRVYVNYPDPWPRRKHHHRRLLRRPFLGLLASRFTDAGCLLLTTDHEGYFEFVLKEAHELYDADIGPPPPEVLGTKWARKGERHFHVALAPKVDSSCKSMDPVEGYGVDVELVDEMYHAVLQGELPEPETFEKRTFKHRAGVSVILDVYRIVGGTGLAFLAHVEESGLRQEVIIEARQGKNGYVVGLKRFGEPLHTRGVGETVHFIAEWLEEEGMTIIHRKY